MQTNDECIDYNQIADTYAQTRSAPPWIIAALTRHVTQLPPEAVILEVGCGTGNHIRTLAAALPDYQYAGFDQSTAMLDAAQRGENTVTFRQGNAQQKWPYEDSYASLIFNVDVIHYIRDLATFFQEAKRVLYCRSPLKQRIKSEGILLIVTDSEADLRNRSLTRYFPEILEHELARYPTVQALTAAATAAGLTLRTTEEVTGSHAITDAHVANLAAKSSSALRLIPPEAHAAGVERVRQAQAAGATWHSLYTVYEYSC